MSDKPFTTKDAIRQWRGGLSVEFTDVKFSEAMLALAADQQRGLDAHGAVEFTSGDGEYVAYLGTDPDGSWWAWVKRHGVDYGKAVRGATKEAVEREALRVFGCRCRECRGRGEAQLRRDLTAMLPEAARPRSTP